MLLCKNRRLFAVFGDNSHVLTHIPMHLIPIPIPCILLPFPWESHGTHGIPVFPIPMHTSNTARNNASCTQARKTTHGLGGQHLDVDRTPRGRVSQNDRGQILMEKVRPWCGHPSDRGRLKNRTVRFSQGSTFQASAKLRRGFVVCLPLSVCYYAR